MIDRDNDGIISIQELKDGYETILGEVLTHS